MSEPEPLLPDPGGFPGRVDARGRADLWSRVAGELAAASRAGTKGSGRRADGGLASFFKYGPVRGKARLRLWLRERVFGVDLAPWAESANLRWLRSHGFHAPEPLLAGVVVRGRLPAFLFLYTAELPGHVPLEDVLTRSAPDERRPVLAALAGEVARLHAAGFVHRDLFARNVMIDPTRPGAPAFLDCRRGGRANRGPFARGPAYDLACLDLDVEPLVSARERAELLDAYFAARESLGVGLRRERILAGLRRERASLARRRRGSSGPEGPPA